MFKKTLLFLILLGSLFSLPAHAFQEGVDATDTYYHYVPAAISNGYGRVAGLNIATTDDLDVCWYYEDDSTCTAITEGNQTDTCPPASGQACLTDVGNGVYNVGIDASLVTETGKMLCIDVQDVQASRTVGDQILCKYIYPEARDRAAHIDDNWNELKAGHSTADSFGDYLDTEVSGVGGGTPLTSQQTRDAMKLAPTVGAPSAGSVDEHLDDILADTADIQPNYATSAAQTTAQNDLDIITGSDGTTLATTQGNYAPAKAGDSMALTAAAVDAILDDTVDGTRTLREVLCAVAASQLGKSSGMGTTSVIFRNIDDDTNVIAGTMDSSFNRTGVTLSLGGCN